MPRLRPGTAKIQFATSLEMPSLIYRACLATDTVSNTAYIQRALAQALARDLGMDVERIMENIPPNRGPALHLFNPADGKQVRPRRMVGPGNTIEDVR